LRQAPPMSAVRVAYAIRWLELEDGVERPPWGEWITHGLSGSGQLPVAP
jgi:hypothetical protein